MLKHNLRIEPPPAVDRGDTVAMIVALLFPALLTWVYFVALAHSDPRWQQLAYGVGKMLQFAFPVVWVAIVRRERIRLAWPRMAGLPTGLGFGLLVLAGALAGYHLVVEPSGLLTQAAATMREKIANFHIQSLGGFLAMGVFYSLVHSFLEEYYWRWFVFGRLRRLVPVGVAIVVSAVGFTLHHVLVLGFYFGLLSWPTLVFSLAVTVGGAFWAWLYERTGSLYGPWLSHLLVDAAIFLVGYDLVRPWLT